MIKRIFISIVLILFNYSGLFAQSDGIKFFNGTFEQALQQSKKDNMLLIIDCYTTWCGPCKNMTDNVFTTKTCGDFFNGKFVFFKIDMEKGEGIELKKRFAVRAFPTFLILNGDGVEQHRLVGGGTAETFIERVKLGVNPKTSFVGLTKRYADGERGTEFIERYANVLFEVKKKEEGKKVYDGYYDSLSDELRQSPENWWLFNFQDFTDFGSAKFDYLLKNKKSFSSNIGKEKYNELVEGIVATEYERHISGIIRNIVNDKEVIQKRAEQLLLCKVKNDHIKLLKELFSMIRNRDIESYKKPVERFIAKLNDEKAFELYELYSSNSGSGIEHFKFSNLLGTQLISRLENEKYIKRVEQKISLNNRIIDAIYNSSLKSGNIVKK